MTMQALAVGARMHVRAVPRAGTDAARITGKYLSVMSYRRDGTGVATPVWFVTEGNRLLVMTAEGSGKVKRISRNPSVGIAASSARGRLRSVPIPARAEILPPTEVERVKRMMGRKYRFDLLFIRPIRAIQTWRHPERKDEETAILAVTPS
jgi:PPOX class probable F420-dependent enzyme